MQKVRIWSFETRMMVVMGIAVSFDETHSRKEIRIGFLCFLVTLSYLKKEFRKTWEVVK